MRKAIVMAVFLFSLLIIPHKADGKNHDNILGFNSGYTWGIRGIHAGLNLQHYFSSHWGIQVEYHYQRETPRDDSFTICYLNVIYRVIDKKKGKFSWYISTGVGMMHMNPSVLFSKVGQGMKWSFSPRLSLHLGFSVWPAPLFIMGPPGFKLFPSGGPNFVSLHVGLEYGF